MDYIHERLNKLLKERGWSEYKLAKQCGLSESTLANIFRRNNCPSFTTLQTICDGFNISLSEFFTDGETVELTPELKNLFNRWIDLTPKQKEAVLTIIEAFKD